LNSARRIVSRYPPRLALDQQLGDGATAGLIVEIEIAERLPGGVVDDEALRMLLDHPRWHWLGTETVAPHLRRWRRFEK
jgi:hypothetical protein